MWPFSRQSVRRTEIRRTRAERVGTWYTYLAEKLDPSWLAVMLLTAAAVCLILSAGGPQTAIRVGESLPRTMTARVDFELEDAQQTRDVRIRARDSSPNVYALDATLIDDIRGRLKNALNLAKADRDDPAKLREDCAKNKVLLKDDAAVAEVLRLALLEDTSEYDKAVEQALQILRSRPLVEPESASVRRTATRAILSADGQADRTCSVAQLAYTNDHEAIDRLLEDAAQAFPAPLRAGMHSSLLAMLSNESGDALRPVYRFDSDRTNHLMLQAQESVATQYLKYTVGDALADQGIVTREERNLLDVEQACYLRQRLAQARWYFLPETLGRSFLACLVAFGVLVYVARYQEDEHGSILRRTMTAIVVLLLLGLSRWTFVDTEAPRHVAVGYQALAAAILAVVYRPGVVFALSAGLAALITLAVQGGIGHFVLLLAVSGTFVFGLREVRSRGRIVMVGLLASLVAASTSACLGVVEGQSWQYVLLIAIAAGGTALLAAFVVEGMLPIIERVFRVRTGMTLLAWCDANKPLLRMMAADAPGTYNHSLLVGALAEASAEAIDADGLLARAGAYYHDIGKTNKPEYFVENQSAGEASRHERLSPAMSVLIIINHVKDGIEMAREYHIPDALKPFIAEHHGTTLVEYFYHAASRQRKPDDREISDTEYRYPGPKPQSRETAIVMLADGVEGAVRAMSEPTPSRIEDVVREIVRKRLLDGQLDECDLTFKELAVVERSLVKSLCGIYHSRIVYPESDEEDERESRKSAVRSVS
ncbi:MAG: HDIG domain-containing protein [Planctomycetes bacterium]|nr:HDIG domain-containing protein [Planctomycetota bacterium]